ncbi:MAG: hypothetical protein M1818_002843 [Claussenomyces sp. TS43310]|nr:MAG: hypothetical protein M1818_002843 [Claussenomyces sp. TS43310]
MANPPPVDPELVVENLPKLGEITPEVLKSMRAAMASPADVAGTIDNRPMTHSEHRIPSSDGSGYEIILSCFHPRTATTTLRPCIYNIHGGAMMWGDRHHTLSFALDAVVECDAVCVSVEYRLAPEHAFPTPLEDCYDGLAWVSKHAAELGIDSTRIMIAGISAGGTFSAATALLCRDRKGPKLCAQVLGCPALDDRLVTPASYQYVDGVHGVAFSRELMLSVWEKYLGGREHSKKAMTYAAPGRTEDLLDLPPAFIDVGSADVLRDEAVAYASKLWACGVQAELHVWRGGSHGFELFLPHAALSKACLDTRMAWVKKELAKKAI